MCGIIGYVGPECKHFCSGPRALEYRGYDSPGSLCARKRLEYVRAVGNLRT
jgi:glucosamine 6-phosphate synthetase-like amidotransferase/phosphosugar isomerase protein